MPHRIVKSTCLKYPWLHRYRVPAEGNCQPKLRLVQRLQDAGLATSAAGWDESGKHLELNPGLEKRTGIAGKSLRPSLQAGVSHGKLRLHGFCSLPVEPKHGSFDKLHKSHRHHHGHEPG